MPESEFRMPTPTVRVQMADGRVLSARVFNADFIRWDRTRAKHGWAQGQEGPFMYSTFLAWSALTREGQIPGMTWEEFSERQAEVVDIDRGATEAETNGVDPTRLTVTPT